MEKERKLTKKERFGIMKEIVERADINEDERAEALEFIEKEIALLNKKRASGTKTTKQKENDELVEKLYGALVEIGRPVTISELQAENEDFGALSNQRVSALMKKLKDAGRVNRVDDKKKAYFSIAE